MRELKSNQPLSIGQKLICSFLAGLRRILPKRKLRRTVPCSPDLALESALREHIPFLFDDWGAYVCESRTGSVVLQCGSFRLRADREREFLVFFTAATTKPYVLVAADIAIAAACGEDDRDLMSDRTSLECLATALKPRVAKLQSAFSSERLARTEEAIRKLQDAAEERFRVNLRGSGFNC